ncbi:MAG: hypothetical protein ACHQ2Z_10380 [Elusimicrobiota bacterium]
MNELIKILGLAKIRVDAGFSRVGRRLKADEPADRALMLLAARAVSTGNALTLLCRDGHANEALPLLRAVAEFASSMRWIAAAETGPRARVALAELDAPRWEGLWPDARLKTRAEDFGVPAWAASAALGSAPDFSRGNASGLPWGHVFADGMLPGRKAEETLAAAAVWLALALEALDRRWPGDFPGAAEMRDGAQISRGK